jgi:hypothetical protein
MSQTLTRERLKRYLGIGDDALRELLRAGLPATWLSGTPGVGRYVVFNREDVDEWLRAKGKADAKRLREQADRGSGDGADANHDSPPAPPRRRARKAAESGRSKGGRWVS